MCFVLSHKFDHITYHLSREHDCLPGDRGLRGPPGDKPHIPAQIIVDMKGAKGDHGNEGTKGFIGPRGVQPQSDISHSFFLTSSVLLRFTSSHSYFPAGSKGLPGVPGSEGYHGLPGDPNNEKGVQGDPGPQGLPGLKGMPGLTGNKGISGFGGMPGKTVSKAILVICNDELPENYYPTLQFPSALYGCCSILCRYFPHIDFTFKKAFSTNLPV